MCKGAKIDEYSVSSHTLACAGQDKLLYLLLFCLSYCDFRGVITELHHNAQRGQDWRLRSTILSFFFSFSAQQPPSFRTICRMLHVLSRRKLDSTDLCNMFASQMWQLNFTNGTFIREMQRSHDQMMTTEGKVGGVQIKLQLCWSFHCAASLFRNTSIWFVPTWNHKCSTLDIYALTSGGLQHTHTQTPLITGLIEAHDQILESFSTQQTFVLQAAALSVVLKHSGKSVLIVAKQL